jgi:hypothetical protein
MIIVQQKALRSRCMMTLPELGAEALALQLRFCFEMGATRFCLVGASPDRPRDDMGGSDAPLRELDRNTTDFLDRPADQERRLF